MVKDKFDNPVFSSKDLIHALYAKPIDLIFDSVVTKEDNDIQKFNKHADSFNIKKLNIQKEINCTIDEFDCVLQNEWLFPKEYKQIDIKKHLLDLCANNFEKERCLQELVEYEKRNLLPLLQYIHYLVQVMRSNKIVWGVGRGSSVSSFVLYLLEINKINPLKYNLDWREFFR